MWINVLWVALVAVVAYLLGSISFAVIVSKWYAKQDVRNFGSGNAGMSNVLRTFGKYPAVLTLAGDFLKSVVAVMFGRLVFSLVFGDDNTLYGAYVAGICALLGHIFPVFFGFKGGKGVLTSMGIMVVIDPLSFICSFAVFGLVFLIWRMMSLSSICMSVAFPVFTFVFSIVQGKDPLFNTIFAGVIGGIVIFMHRANIGRIAKGDEYKFGSDKHESGGAQL